MGKPEPSQERKAGEESNKQLLQHPSLSLQGLTYDIHLHSKENTTKDTTLFLTAGNQTGNLQITSPIP